MNLTRRLFARSAPTVAAAGAMAARGYSTEPSPASLTPPTDFMGAEKAMCDAASPMVDLLSGPRRLFREAISKERNPSAFSRRVKEWQSMHPNIEVLRSVSKQHKIHMMFKHQDEVENREHTWLQSIADRFGFTEFKNKYSLY